MTDEKTYLVESGNAAFLGTRYGVVFSGGKGRATSTQAERLVRDLGYTCPALHGGEESAPQLIEIDGLGKRSVEKLNAAGVETLSDLIEADVGTLAEKTKIVQGTLEDWQAQAAHLMDSD